MIEFILLPLAFIVGMELGEFSLYGRFLRNPIDIDTLIKFINQANDIEVISENRIIFYTRYLKRDYVMMTISKKQLVLSKYNIKTYNSVNKKVASSRVLRCSEAEKLIDAHFNKWQRRNERFRNSPDGTQVSHREIAENF
ncbi:MAG: hypothetical protein EKK55_22515 [Rhodocyclaceae bacterium]|nr:MAG: hypothetical protein EKK55_22515 [Rhodocyclaceae bacterium]